MSTGPTRMAIYLRVGKQDPAPENQVIQVREFCERWEGR